MTLNKFIFTIVLFLTATILINAQEDAPKVGIEFFKGTFDEAKAKAKEENKYIFVDVFTTWCGPCKKLSKTTFKDASVGDFHNRNFINVKIDAEKGEGPSFASAYKVSAYPTMIFFDSNGKLVEKAKGFLTADRLLEKSKKLFVNEDKLKELTAEFENGNRDSDFISELLNLQNLMGKIDPRVEEAFISGLKKEDITNEQNSQFIFDGASKLNSKFFDLLMDNRVAFEELKGKKVVDEKIRNASVNAVKTAIENKDKALVDKAMNAFKTIDIENKDLYLFNFELEYFKGIEDWKSYAKHATGYLGKNEVENHNLLNNIAWTFYEKIDNKKQMKLAEEWALQSIALNSNYHNNDTYAALLYKQGKIDEAYTAAEKAITIAKYKRQDFTATKKLMDKINEERYGK